MPYKILSLDGGGSWALIQARVLQDIYNDANGWDILKQFDLVIANSGGSMVLAALCCDLKPSQIAAIFENEEERRKVFKALTFRQAPFWKFVKLFSKSFGPRYKATEKKEGLRTVLKKYAAPDKFLGEWLMSKIPSVIGLECPELIVCGYNYFTRRAMFFRSNSNSKTDGFNSNKYDVTLLDAIHASSNAPLNYFDEPALISTGLLGTQPKTPAWYWDGAVGGFNNPIMAGVVEAITNGHGTKASDFRILSLGTGTGRRPVMVGWDKGTDEQKKDFEKNKTNDLVITDTSFGFLKDVSEMATSILSDPPDAASFVAYSVLQPSLDNDACIVRINPCINPVKKTPTSKYEVPEAWGDDNNTNDRKSFIRLLDLDMDAVNKEDVELITTLCKKFIVTSNDITPMPNQYIRGDGTGPKTIGYGTYKEAKNKWLQSVGPAFNLPPTP